ncbi:DUF4114 domain-containing protein, partial [Cylindrospermum sp. FACHB-282]|uniref:DUF4114 domain-containing protein n=1 Tax=Cylindrospermum sp. FACHB-282 TaxID=2692794 RepID=UPI0016876557
HDSVAEGYSQLSVTNTATSADTKYNNLSTSVAADVGDNDTVGINANQVGGTAAVVEGATAVYAITLNSEPIGEVTITISSSDTSELTTDVTTLTFNASNWDTAQNVTVTAVENDIATSTAQIHYVATSSGDTQYNITKSVDVEIANNDTVGINANQVGGTAAILEGDTAVYGITLNSQPTDDVTLTITSVDTSQLSLDVTTLTFNASNWNTAQNVTVMAIDDDIEQGDRTVSINYAVTSNDANYSAIGTDSDAINIIDDDIPLAKGDDNDIFTINSNTNRNTLEVTLQGSSSNFVNELGVFNVDDAQGTIDGIAPGAAGYAEAALNRSKVIFSTIANLPNGFNPEDLTTLLNLNSGDNVRFYLIQNSTSDSVRSTGEYGKVLFSDSQNAKITTSEDGTQYSIGWNDGSSNSAGDFSDLVVNFETTNASVPLGTNLQSLAEGEVIDLRSVTGQVTAEFVVNREASFNNFIGFYKVVDQNGGIDTNGDGQTDISVGDAGYIQAAVSGRIAGIDLTVNNQGTATYTGTFQAGAIYAPFLIVDSNPDAILDSNSSNDPGVYFTYLGSNTDGTDHVRLLGNNTFGFEDLTGGGDNDFNDVIVKVNLSIT